MIRLLNGNKKVREQDFIHYLAQTLKAKNNYNFSDEMMRNILLGIEQGINSLVEEGYSFKMFGFNFNSKAKNGVIYKNISSGDISYSKPHRRLEIKIPRSYQKNLKEKTRFNTNKLPDKLGITDEEYRDGLNRFFINKL